VAGDAGAIEAGEPGEELFDMFVGFVDLDDDEEEQACGPLRELGGGIFEEGRGLGACELGVVEEEEDGRGERAPLEDAEEELVEALCVVLREGGGLVAWAEETCDAEVVAVLVEADGAELEREFAGEVVVVEFADAEEVVEGFAESAETAFAFAVVEAAGVSECHGGGEFVAQPEGEAALAHAGLGLDGLDAGVAAGDDRERRLHEGAAVVAAAYERGVGSQRGVG
jgi:hypothetical protein